MSELPKCVSSDSLFELRQSEKQSSIQPLPVPVKTRVRKDLYKMKAEDAHNYELWLSHRERLRNISFEVKNKPPDYQWARRTGASSLSQNAVCFMERTKKSIQMLVELNKIIRTHGVVNPFRYERVYTMSSLPLLLKRLDQMELENLDIGKRLLDVVSEVDTGLKRKNRAHSIQDRSRKRRRSSAHLLGVSDRALSKYAGYNIVLPRTERELRLLCRPQIYFDVFLKDSLPLGRLIIELYTEAAPLVVRDLMRICKAGQNQKLVIRRVFPELWMDVEMPLGRHSELHRPLEYDGKVADHALHGCILSFRRDCLQGFYETLTFSISFRPMRVAKASRLGFGRIIRGARMFDSLQCYGTKNGKLSRILVLSGCGVV